MTKLKAKVGNAGGATKLVAEVGVRPSSRRAKLLTALAVNKNRPIPVRTLVKAVYGRSGGGAGPLYMVMSGLEAKIKKAHLPFALRKARIEGDVTYGLFAKAHR